MASFTGNEATGIAVSGTITVTIPTPTQGNVLLVCIGNAGSGSLRQPNTPVATGVTWTNANGSNNGLVEVHTYYGLVGAGAGTTVTITFNGAILGAGAHISEWSSGITTTSDFELSDAATGSISSRGPTFARSGDLYIYPVALTTTGVVGGTFTPSSPFIALNSGNPLIYNGTASALVVGYQLNASSGAQSNPSWSDPGVTGTVTWASITAGIATLVNIDSYDPGQIAVIFDRISVVPSGQI